MLKITELTEKGSLSRWFTDQPATVYALDLETTDLGKGSPILSGAVTGRDENEVAFFRPDLIPELLAAKEGTRWVGHNFSFDLKHLSWAGVCLQDKYEYTDTMVLAHLSDENQEMGLGALVEKHFASAYKAEFKARFKNVKDADPESLKQYNAKDVHYTLRLYSKLNHGLAKDGVPATLVDHVHQLQRSLLETEIAGIRVDTDYLMQKGVELKTAIERLLPAMRAAVPEAVEVVECEEWVKEIEKRKTTKGRAGVKRPEFCFDSAKQLQRLLYDQLGLEKQYNDKTKQLTTDYDALDKLKDQHPIIPMLLEYREKQKIYSTYVQGSLEKIVGGRIYPNFNCTGTATGRISHSNPNMGNMPAGGGIRGMFIPDPGHVFVTADYSSLEVYIEAHFTGDKNLLRLVNEGISKHDLTAAEVGIPRSTAKTVNFLAQYHGTAFKLSKVLGCSQDEAQKILDKYWNTYGGCKALKAETDRMVDAGEPIINPFGRRRRFEKKQRKPWDGDYRAAYNARIQGTGSDCMSLAFYTVDQKLKELGWGRALFTLHDEAVLQVKEEYAEQASELLVETMVWAGTQANLTVTLKAEPCIMKERWND